MNELSQRGVWVERKEGREVTWKTMTTTMQNQKTKQNKAKTQRTQKWGGVQEETEKTLNKQDNHQITHTCGRRGTKVNGTTEEKGGPWGCSCSLGGMMLAKRA